MVTTPRMAAVLTVVVGFALQRVVCLEQKHNVVAEQNLVNRGIPQGFSPEYLDEQRLAARQGTLTSTSRPQTFLTASVSVPDSSLTTLSTSAVQTAKETLASLPSGTVVTSLTTSAAQPFPTSTTATRPLRLAAAAADPTTASTVTAITANNIFQPIATDAPPAQIPRRGDHPAPRLNIQRQQYPLQTNKFYANLFVGSQTAPVFTHPYSLTWTNNRTSVVTWGMGVSHIERNQLAAGLANPGYDAGQWAYYINPIGIYSIILSAAELRNGTKLTTDTIDAFSANANLIAAGASLPTITFPLVQGMGFVTGVYRSATPLLQSGVAFQRLTYVGTVLNGATYKYRVLLGNGYTWLIYVSPSNQQYPGNKLTLVNAASIQGPSGFSGTIQIAKIPSTATDSGPESIYDSTAGTYATGATIDGSVNGKTGSYTFSFTKKGITSQPLLMFALPHHRATLASGGLTSLQLMTTTKGMATAVRANSWTLQESNLPIDMSFAPWTPARGSITKVAAAAVSAINAAGYAELQQNISAQANVGSLYYDGKALAKFAAIIYTLNDIAGNTSLALSGLKALQQAFALHVDNKMAWPLAYDTAWGGVVSSATYVTGDAGVDFGNTYYNDHHFHFGYFVYTAAVIGYLDPSWLNAGTNKAWVNTLVRDYANSIKTDLSFPFSRSFDWYHGHSWASGLFEALDGRNQESSSEDTMASYGLKMWGQVIGDINMQARGNLMLAIQARSLQSYYLTTDDNTILPSQFIGNRAAGILFDNKVDHTTYFGDNPEYVQGIHMLPLMPFSAYIRTQTFVKQEWASYFSSKISSIVGGWRGILMANYAIVDAPTVYRFFADARFDSSYLDGGASRTWYLAWSAALGGV